METITINTPEELLTFVKRDNISSRAAIDLFEGAFSIVAIIFVDAQTREPNFEKEKVIKKIEGYINNCKNGQFDKVVVFS